MMVLWGSLAAQWLLSQVLPSPWWVPDVALAGVVVSVAASPKRWVVVGVAAGVAMLPWLTRALVPLGAGYLVCAAAVRELSTTWDASDARLQLGVTAAASLLMTVGAMGLARASMWPVAGPALLHTALTALCVIGLRRFRARA